MAKNKTVTLVLSRKDADFMQEALSGYYEDCIGESCSAATRKMVDRIGVTLQKAIEEGEAA